MGSAGLAITLLLVTVTVNTVAFFGLRVLTASSLGFRGQSLVRAVDDQRWATASATRKGMFVLAGPAGVYLCAVALTTIGLLLTGRESVDETGMHLLVVENGAAAMAGARDGDRLVAVDEVAVTDWTQLRGIVAARGSKPMQLAVERDGQMLHLTTTPQPNGKLLIQPMRSHEDIGFAAALGAGSVAPLALWADYFKGLASTVGPGPELSGPVGIVKKVSKTTPRSRIGAGFQMSGAVSAFGLWIPLLAALFLLPRAGRVNA